MKAGTLSYEVTGTFKVPVTLQPLPPASRMPPCVGVSLRSTQPTGLRPCHVTGEAILCHFAGEAGEISQSKV